MPPSLMFTWVIIGKSMFGLFCTDLPRAKGSAHPLNMTFLKEHPDYLQGWFL